MIPTAPDSRLGRLGLARTLSTALPTVLAGGIFTLFLPPSGLFAQQDDEARERWVFEGELTSVLAGGNSESLALGAGASTRRHWEKDALRFEAGWTRVETARISRRAVGTPDDFVVNRDVDREKTAESIKVRGRYDRSVSETFTIFGGVDWLRNTFAGIDSRILMAAGSAKRWFDSDRSRFSTDLAATYTFQADVVENPFVASDFAGVRVGWEYWREVTGTTEFESELTGDLNLKETEDLRVELINSLTVDISDVVALKPSLELQWRNLPALIEVPLFTPGGSDTGDAVDAPLKKLDYFFRMALVLSF